jgi:hypothetical protein
MRRRILPILLLCAAALLAQESESLTQTRVPSIASGSGSWTLSYTPYAYPHPLQTAWVSSCKETRAAASPSRSDVQSAVNKAHDDDCVTIPAGGGAETWTSPVSLTNKRIQIIGPGEADLTITCRGTCIAVTVDRTPARPFRVSGLTFAWSGQQNIITGVSSALTVPVEGFRIDHLTFLNSNTNGSHSIIFNGGIWWGLVDHVTMGNGTTGWIGVYAGAYTENDFDRTNRCAASGNMPCVGFDSWALKGLEFGSRDAIYIEDSVFNYNSRSGLSAVNDMEFGARMVYRFNTCTACYYQAHSARGRNRGGNVQSEIYRNTFVGDSFYRPTGPIRSGTALLFENALSGYEQNNWHVDGQRENTSCAVSGPPIGACNGSAPQDGNIEPNGWPCVDGVGRGGAKGQTTEASRQTSAPMRSWSNGSMATCRTGGTCDNATNITLNPVCRGLAAYIKPHSTPHSNGQWDYMNYGDGVYVVDTLGDLPASCTPGEWAWVRNAGSWNAAGQDGLGYVCAGSQKD